MILAFSLSMPNCASWNGKWSGDGKKYVIVKTFRSKNDIEKAKKIRDTGYYRYSWPDGWSAGITVTEVTPSQAASLRRSSEGFCGYGWMVQTICLYGAPMSSSEVEQFLNNQKMEKVEITAANRESVRRILQDELSHDKEKVNG